jgi:hypothetical protein
VGRGVRVGWLVVGVPGQDRHHTRLDQVEAGKERGDFRLSAEEVVVDPGRVRDGIEVEPPRQGMFQGVVRAYSSG